MVSLPAGSLGAFAPEVYAGALSQSVWGMEAFPSEERGPRPPNVDARAVTIAPADVDQLAADFYRTLTRELHPGSRVGVHMLHTARARAPA